LKLTRNRFLLVYTPLTGTSLGHPAEQWDKACPGIKLGTVNFRCDRCAVIKYHAVLAVLQGPETTLQLPPHYSPVSQPKKENL
jgi:hypothetical protein